MGCARGPCAAERVFIFINIAFAMYSGALLATAARLAWDPSTYTWFKYLCAAQYRVSAAYVLAVGLWLAALVSVAAAATRRPAAPPRHGRDPLCAPPRSRASARRSSTALHLYCCGVACLVLSEVGYSVWMCVSLAAWWRTAPEAREVRRGMDLVHDMKPALLAMEHFRDTLRPVYDMIEEIERKAPNNVYVIVVFAALGAMLQVAAFVTARRLAGRWMAEGGAAAAGGAGGAKDADCGGGDVDCDADCDADCDPAKPPTEPSSGWRKNANLRMYTILDKIF